MSNLRIVPAAESDIPVILDLIHLLAEYEKLAHVVTANPERLRETLFGSKPAAEVVLAHWDRECAGFAVFFSTYSTFLALPGLYLEDLYVKPHLRGKGLGLALLKHVAGIAAERGCGRVEWGVLDWNKPAIQFYTKLGAIPMNEWTKYRLTGEALKSLALSA
jgi:GNAT superfamily N-acetyltransferase